VLAALVSSTLLNCIFPFFTYVESSGMLGEFLPQVREPHSSWPRELPLLPLNAVFPLSTGAVVHMHAVRHPWPAAATFKKARACNHTVL
jgi:hypothetical protein